VDKKIALEGSLPMNFISGEIPGTRIQKKISNISQREKQKTNLQKNKGI